MTNSKMKRYIILGAVLCALYLIASNIGSVIGGISFVVSALKPFFIGCVTAYIVNIPMSFFEKHYIFKGKVMQKCKNSFCMIGAFLCVAAILFLVVNLVLPELISCISLLADKIPPALEAAYKYVMENWLSDDVLPGLYNSLSSQSIDWQSLVQRGINVIFSGVGGAMNYLISTVSSTLLTIFDVAVGIIFSIYMLLNKRKLKSQVSRLTDAYMKPQIKSRAAYVLDVLDHSFHHFIVGQCTEAVILGLLCIIGMLLFRFPYAVMIGTLVGFTALIPVAGAYIGAGVGAFMIFTVSPFQALMFLIFIIVLQQIEGNVIYPKVVGSSISLPGMWVLLAITLGGSIAGISGMLVGVPLTAALYQLVRADVKKRQAVQPVSVDEAAAEAAKSEPGDGKQDV